MRRLFDWIRSLWTRPIAATRRRDRLDGQAEQDALGQQFRGGL